MNQYAPPQPPGVTPPRKGLPPLAWLGIGCGGFLVVGILVAALLFGWARRKYEGIKDEFATNPQRAAAELIVELNPDVEMVGEDEELGEMTIRVKSTGEEITVSYSELTSGKFTVTDSDGTVTTVGEFDDSKVPVWVPRYPTMLAQAAGYHQDTGSGAKGVIAFSTGDSPEDVTDFYETQMSGATTTSSSTITLDSMTRSEITLTDGDKELTINASSTRGGTSNVQVTYKDSAP